MKQRYLVIGAVFLGLLFSNAALAASKKKPTPPPQSHPPTIVAATADSVTVKDDKTTKTLGINQFTEITVNGQKATAAQLKPGMVVTTLTLGADATKASRIVATGK